MMIICKTLKFSALILISSFFLSNAVYAAAVVKRVSGKKVIILNKGKKLKRGQTYYLLSKSRRKKGIIEIKSVKRKRSIGKLIKGKARRGYKLKKKRKSSTHSKAAKQPILDSNYWGITAGITSNTMSTKSEATSEAIDLASTGFILKGLLDYAIFETLWFRGQLGILGFNLEGDDSVALNITYLSADIWGRWLMSLEEFRPWLGIGFDLLFPVANKNGSGVLDQNSITNTSIIGFGLGFDWMLSDDSYIPFQIEYSLFPSSDQVTANYIGVTAGIAYRF